MIYVYCRRASDSARALAEALEGQRLRNFDGMRFWRKNRPVRLMEDDVVVSWGDALPEIPNIRVLNGATIPNKAGVATLFAKSGIPTISLYTPSRYSTKDHAALLAQGYIPRMNNHVGGNDLLNPPTNPDFWVLKQKFLAEYRIHSFNSKSIRAGIKKLREGYTLDAAEASSAEKLMASTWVRSYDGGWRICYDSFKSNETMRELAHRAVQALGLTFGAVDIAKVSNGKYIVLEVNRAPGLEGNSITIYANAIKEWINEAGGIQAGSGAVGEDLRPEGAPADPINLDTFVFTIPANAGRIVAVNTTPPDAPPPAIQPEQPAPAPANIFRDFLIAEERRIFGNWIIDEQANIHQRRPAQAAGAAPIRRARPFPAYPGDDLPDNG